MKKEKMVYMEPEVKTIEFIVESGIAGSTGAIIYDPNEDDYNI